MSLCNILPVFLVDLFELHDEDNDDRIKCEQHTPTTTLTQNQITQIDLKLEHASLPSSEDHQTKVALRAFQVCQKILYILKTHIEGGSIQFEIPVNDENDKGILHITRHNIEDTLHKAGYKSASVTLNGTIFMFNLCG